MCGQNTNVEIHRFAKSLNKYAKTVESVAQKQHKYSLHNYRNNTIASILCFRKLTENIQTTILESTKQKIITTKTIAQYVQSMQSMGMYRDNITAEITSAISCITYTPLYKSALKMQDIINTTFFPFESYLCNITMNKEFVIQNSINNDQFNAESLSHNLISLIKKLKKYKFTLQSKISYKKQQNNIQYVDFLIKRLELQANKLAAIAYNNICNNTYIKLKSVV